MSYPLKQGQVLSRKPGKELSRKPETLVVETKNPEDEWIIALWNGDKKTMMPKSSIYKFYEPATYGQQGELFGKPETRMDQLKKKHLKNGGNT